VSERFRPVVLCYHAVSATWDHLLSVPPSAFEVQLRLLRARGYAAASAADVVRGHGRLFHVTFDDALRSVANALPALERHRVPATVFACTSYADGGRLFDVPELVHEAAAHPEELRTMDWEALAELVERGVEVGSHTRTHPHLSELDEGELRDELVESREKLEAVLGRPCRFLAFPSGEHDGHVRGAARAAGYDAAFALPGRSKPWDPFAIPRVGIWRHTSLVRATVKTSRLSWPVEARRGWR
jgi:peptidoglycan/xylan/chitin deacetylase (PgdA/CDA1 family)